MGWGVCVIRVCVCAGPSCQTDGSLERRRRRRQGDALGGCPCGEEREGCPCDAGGLEQDSSAPSLIKQLFPQQQATSPTSAPHVMGLPTPHCQLSSVGEQVKELSCQSHAAPVGLSRETDSDSIRGGRNQPVEATRSPG